MDWICGHCFQRKHEYIWIFILPATSIFNIDKYSLVISLEVILKYEIWMTLMLYDLLYDLLWNWSTVCSEMKIVYMVSVPEDPKSVFQACLRCYQLFSTLLLWSEAFVVFNFCINIGFSYVKNVIFSFVIVDVGDVLDSCAIVDVRDLIVRCAIVCFGSCRGVSDILGITSDIVDVGDDIVSCSIVVVVDVLVSLPL